MDSDRLDYVMIFQDSTSHSGRLSRWWYLSDQGSGRCIRKSEELGIGLIACETCTIIWNFIVVLYSYR